MKHYSKLLLVAILILLILAGCNTRNLEFERTYPDMTELDAIKAEQQKERESSPEYQKYKHLIDSNTKPSPISLLTSKEDNSIDEFQLQATIFCWKSSLLECPDFDNSVVLENPDLPVYTIKKRKPITLYALQLSDETPSPTNAEMLLFTPDGHLYPFAYGMSSTHSYEFEAPEDVGSYTLIIKVIYNNSIGGVALFPVMLDVTE